LNDAGRYKTGAVSLKIENINSADSLLRNLSGGTIQDSMADKGILFSKCIMDADVEHTRAVLLSLTEKIDAQGRLLAKKADIRELEKYKNMVREFLNRVVSEGYSFSKENSFEARGRSRVFAVVKKVDEKLDALAAEVLSGQADNLKILGHIDDIRGLILDIML
jgi:uncharacterized protein YaaR (DUF327 family)